MLVLALETAVARASVVLADDDRELSAWRADTQRDLCSRLASEIGAVISRAGRTFDDLDLVAVGLGPGSFTALRVGLATAKALALARDLPLVGIPSLAAMAWHVRDRLPGLVCPMLDARRGEVYAALYRVAPEHVAQDRVAPERVAPERVERVEPEFAAGPAGLAERLSSAEEPVTLFGQLDRLPAADIARALPARASLWRNETILPDALAVAQLARRRFAAAGPDAPASLRPIYVRLSYAEERFDIDLGLR
jgi:tRNA threonylcarbamoyladenosine biosynthesis protein TsaB